MASEIDEIPDAVSRELGAPSDAFQTTLEAIRRRPPRFAVIVARGTSDHAATYARYLIETSLRIPTGSAAPSVATVYGASLDWQYVLCLAISQSGEGPDVAGVVERARRGGATTVAITNDPTSSLAAEAEHVLPLHAGPEVAVAATKTYVASLTVIARLVSTLVWDAPWRDGLAALPEHIVSALAGTDRWLAAAEADISTELARAEGALIVSRGHNLATALELALKLKETCRIFAEGYSSADLLHGPVVLAGAHAPVIVFRPDGRGSGRRSTRRWPDCATATRAPGWSGESGPASVSEDLLSDRGCQSRSRRSSSPCPDTGSPSWSPDGAVSTRIGPRAAQGDTYGLTTRLEVRATADGATH
jgi:glucosamine--fructose-6-phosphate aminotransferase (isomerizing)